MSALVLVLVAACGSTRDAGMAGRADGGTGADANPLCVVTDTYTFGFEGGIVASFDESVLSPPSQYHHVRTYNRYASDGGTTMCAPEPDCQVMNSLGLSDVVVLLQNADVRAALSQATPPLYGHDSRPVDGQVYSIMRSDGRGMLVGTACTTDQVDCRAIPSGIGNLVLALQMFDERMLAKPECRGL
jgi:hypothetical protein